MYNRLLFIAILLFAAGCGAKKEPSPMIPILQAKAAQKQVEEVKQYTETRRDPNMIAPGYELQLSSLDDPNLNGKYRVGFNGRVKLPYDVELQAAEKYPQQLKNEVRKAYAPFFKAVPQVDLNITERKLYVEIGGLVETPGRYLVGTDSNLDMVLGAAKGLQSGEQTQARYVRIEKGDQSSVVRLADYYGGARHLIPTFQGGESLFLQSERGEFQRLSGTEANYVQVLGQVRVPGDQMYKPGADFFHYLVEAGGPTEAADLDRIAVISGSGTQRKQTMASLEDGRMPSIQGGDIILVYGDSPSSLEKKTSLGSSITSVFTGLASVVLLAVGL